LSILLDAEPGVGIVYVATVRAAKELAQALQADGVRAERYHGRMGASERERVQLDFMANSFHVLVATVAFGLGIDKPDVRFVVHYHMPDSLESYGAGGRGRSHGLGRRRRRVTPARPGAARDVRRGRGRRGRRRLADGSMRGPGNGPSYSPEFGAGRYVKSVRYVASSKPTTRVRPRRSVGARRFPVGPSSSACSSSFAGAPRRRSTWTTFVPLVA
jgi:hypothetical protein